MSLNSTCGHCWTTARLDTGGADQLSTGIWTAAGTAQQLTTCLGDDELPSTQPLDGLVDLPESWGTPAAGAESTRKQGNVKFA
ncbi:MAG: hypothetical protein ACRDTC_10510 [Pseudonocardiaceae bacterium]